MAAVLCSRSNNSLISHGTRLKIKANVDLHCCHYCQYYCVQGLPVQSAAAPRSQDTCCGLSPVTTSALNIGKWLHVFIIFREYPIFSYEDPGMAALE